ncbi:MAG: response regulator transcription factor [Terriglobia bacterium]
MASEPSLELAGSASNFAQLAAPIREMEPDVVLASLASGLEEFMDEALDNNPEQPPLIALAAGPASLTPAELMQHGIAALLPRDATSEEIIAAVHAAAAGLVVLHPAMIDRDTEFVRPRRLAQGDPAPRLTARELEILQMLSGGLGNKEIAWQLKISEHTVKFHLSSIFTKLDVSSRAEAVSLGYRLGLILM